MKKLQVFTVYQGPSNRFCCWVFFPKNHIFIRTLSHHSTQGKYSLRVFPQCQGSLYLKIMKFL